MRWPEVLLRWSLDPSIVIGIAVTALLYGRGLRNAVRLVDARRTGGRLRRALMFYLGLLVIVVALESPIDALSASLFTFHMVQHLLLIMVAAPLVILGDPAITVLRGVPLGLRRVSLGFLARRPSLRRAGHAVAWLR